MKKLPSYEQIEMPSCTSFRYGWSREHYKTEFPWHIHPEIEINYIASGNGYRIVGDIIEMFEEGDIILLPSNIPHCRIFNPNSCSSEGLRDCFYIQFNTDFLEKGVAFFKEWEKFAVRILSIKQGVQISGESARTVSDLLKRMYGVSEQEQLFFVLRIIQEIGSSADLLPIGVQGKVRYDITPYMKRLQAVFEHIVEHYSEKITLADIARIANMTETSFCAFFKRETGQTFSKYISKYRIGVACTMLRNNTDKDVREIAWACGFSDIPYFNRCFKDIMKMTPIQWRNNAKKP